MTPGMMWSRVLVLAVAASGCSSASPAVEATNTASARHPITGTVIAQPSASTVTLAHDAVKGFMPAMVMDLSGDQLPRLRAGDRVRGTLVVSADSSRLADVEVVANGAPVAVAAPAGAALPGALVPDVALRNQRDQPIRPSDFRGRVLLVTFIYTRCPLPDFCPRLMRNFQELRRALVAEPALSSKVQFLSVSIDPAVDTPAVLHAYGQALLGTTEVAGWDLATGDGASVATLAAFAGLVYEPQAGLVRHSMETLIVGADGRLVKRFSGTSWNQHEALGIVKREARRADVQ